MTPAEANQKAAVTALDESREAYARGGLFFIHYKCDSFDSEPCKIRLIVIKDPATGMDHSFPAMQDERACPQLFRRFVTKKPDRIWAGCNMRNEQ